MDKNKGYVTFTNEDFADCNTKREQWTGVKVNALEVMDVIEATMGDLAQDCIDYLQEKDVLTEKWTESVDLGMEFSNFHNERCKTPDEKGDFIDAVNAISKLKSMVLFNGQKPA